MTTGYGRSVFRPIGASQERDVAGCANVIVALGTGNIQITATGPVITVGSELRVPYDIVRPLTSASAPPRGALFLLYCCLSKKDREPILGDLAEDHGTVLREFGPRKARIFYWSQVIRSIAPMVAQLLIKSSVGAALVGASKWLWSKFGQ